jgi:RNA polymerase sigma-70 factor (ECF subfamily)
VSQSVLQRVAAGDAAAMQGCIDQYGGLVWSLARRLLASATDAEDAVQEVFIALWEAAGRFDPERGGETTFVATIARRRIIDRQRRLKRRERVVDEVASREPPPPPSPDSVGTADEARLAAEAMGDLSRDQQRVLTLAIHYGLKHEQIATHTGMPLGTVKTNARRGLMKVREKLQAARRGESIGSTP